MKKAPDKPATSPKTTPAGSTRVGQIRIHPVIIYPFRQPHDFTDLTELYELVRELASCSDTYARPITVMDRKTHYRGVQNPAFINFRKNTVARCSDLVDAWCVDTCQMWYTGLGLAMERGGPNDVYWLIPGDFNYGSAVGRDVLSRLHDLPEICAELGQDVCVGEIASDHNSSKDWIDTYSTFALLYHWFPTEGREIRQYTERPRSEFFAIRHGFLREMFMRRWYAYEQTVVILLHAVFEQKRLSRFCVGDISDLPEGRESLASAIQQVERTERVLKSLWRERNEAQAGWADRYRELEAQSNQVRSTAVNTLRNLLR